MSKERRKTKRILCDYTKIPLNELGEQANHLNLVLEEGCYADISYYRYVGDKCKGCPAVSHCSDGPKTNRLRAFIREFDHFGRFDKVNLFCSLTILYGTDFHNIRCKDLCIQLVWKENELVVNNWVNECVCDILDTLQTNQCLEKLEISVGNRVNLDEDFSKQLHSNGSCLELTTNDGQGTAYFNFNNAQWRRKLVAIVALGLLASNVPFNSFLTKGIYDPRILLIVGSFLHKPTWDFVYY